MKFLLLVATLLVCGCGGYPPCPVDSAEWSPEGSPPGPPPDWVPPIDPPPGGPAPDGADAEEGYRREPAGYICRCDLGSPGCDAEEPKAESASSGSEGGDDGGNAIDFRDGIHGKKNPKWTCTSTAKCKRSDYAGGSVTDDVTELGHGMARGVAQNEARERVRRTCQAFKESSIEGTFFAEECWAWRGGD